MSPLENQQGGQLVCWRAVENWDSALKVSTHKLPCSESQHRQNRLESTGPVEGLSRVPSPAALSLHAVLIPHPLSGWWPRHASGEALVYARLWLYCLQLQPLSLPRAHLSADFGRSPSLCWAPTPANPKHAPEKAPGYACLSSNPPTKVTGHSDFCTGFSYTSTCLLDWDRLTTSWNW